MAESGTSLLFCEGRILMGVADGAPAPAELFQSAPWPDHRLLDSFWLRPQGVDVVGLSGSVDSAPEGFEWVMVRRLVAEGSPWAGIICRALGLLNWRAARHYCGGCGGRLEEHPKEMAQVCPACGRSEYPAISPAVIIRVEKGDRLLLALHVQRNSDVYSCIAGYVEAGESAEDAVRREVREEVGIEVQDVCYLGSQHWPYPNQLMLAFRAQWKSGDVQPQADEILEAKWFDPADLPAIPTAGSLSHRLIMGLI